MANTKEELKQLETEKESLSKADLKQAVGGFMGEEIIIPIVQLVYGGRRCEICEKQPARRALKNHYMNEHGMSYEEAMSYVPEELRDKQW